MSDTTEHGADAFFREQRNAFVHTLATQGSEAALLQAWDSFDGNVAIQCEGEPRWTAPKAAPPAARCA